MIRSSKYVGLAAVLLAAPVVDAAILVTEFLPNPTGTDADREWFEIYNSGAAPFDLSGYAAGDGTDPVNPSTGEAMGVFPTGSIINAGQVWVIAVDAEGFEEFYGFKPNFEYANSTSVNFPGNDPLVPDLTQKTGWGASNGSLGIANSNDDVGILTPESTPESFSFIDGGNHGNVTTFYTGAITLGSNESYERVPGNQDTDSVNDWIVRASGEATPGVVTIPEPAAACTLGLIGALGLIRRRRSGR